MLVHHDDNTNSLPGHAHHLARLYGKPTAVLDHRVPAIDLHLPSEAVGSRAEEIFGGGWMETAIDRGLVRVLLFW